MNREDVSQAINDMSFDSRDLFITHDADGFHIAEGFSDSAKLSYIEKLDTDEHGRRYKRIGQWRVYQYHIGYIRPREDNYDQDLDDLEEGLTDTVVITTCALEDSWILGVASYA